VLPHKSPGGGGGRSGGKDLAGERRQFKKRGERVWAELYAGRIKFRPSKSSPDINRNIRPTRGGGGGGGGGGKRDHSFNGRS